MKAENEYSHASIVETSIPRPYLFCGYCSNILRAVEICLKFGYIIGKHLIKESFFIYLTSHNYSEM